MTEEQETETRSSKAYATRGQNRGEEIALDVRLRSGDAWAFPYAYLMALRLNADGEILAFFSTHRMTIRGRNLRPLYNLVQQRQVAWIQEGSERHDFDEESETAIHGIEIEELK